MTGRGHLRAPAALVVALAFAIAAPAASAGETLAPASHDFGSKAVQSSATQAFTLGVECALGPGCADSYAPVIGVSGDFSQTNDCPALLSVLGTAACTITVRFTPAAAGARTGTLTTGEPGPSAALSGRGTAALVIDTPVGKVTCAKGKGKVKNKKRVKPCKGKKRSKGGKKKK